MKNPLIVLTLVCAVGILLPGCVLKDKITPPVAAAVGEPTPTPTPIPVDPSAPEPAAIPPRPLLAYAWPPNWYRMIFPKKPEPPQAFPPQVIGVVKMVNPTDRFVLIDAVSFGNIPPGTQFLCIADRQETATLQMSGLKNPPFLIADIVNGHPSPGDKVIKP